MMRTATELADILASDGRVLVTSVHVDTDTIVVKAQGLHVPDVSGTVCVRPDSYVYLVSSTNTYVDPVRQVSSVYGNPALANTTGHP